MYPPFQSVGKIRGLSSTANSEGIFTILAFDHRQSFVKMLDLEQLNNPDFRLIAEAKSQIVRILGPHASAVLLDPVYGATPSIVSGALSGMTGLIVALEETGYTGSDVERVSSILSGWSVLKTKLMGADAVKLLIYYHPMAGSVARKQEDLIKQVIEDCKRYDILLFLEIITYSIDDAVEKSSAKYAAELPYLICNIAQKLGNLGPDVLKLEFPLNVHHEPNVSRWFEACEAVTRASPCPWAILSAAIDFEIFTKQVEVACKSGASGFIAGRAVWQEAVSTAQDQRENWLSAVGSKRLDILTEIASRYGRPWRDYYPDLVQSIGKDWYRKYGE